MQQAIYLSKVNGQIIGLHIHNIKKLQTKTKQIPVIEYTAWKYSELRKEKDVRNKHTKRIFQKHNDG